MIDQLSHVNQLLEAIQQQPRNRSSITAVITQPCTLREECHPSSKSWFVLSRMLFHQYGQATSQ